MKANCNILIISYTTRDLTLACLRSIERACDAASGGLGYEIIVVDNSSVDGSADAIAAEFPRVDLLRLDRNIGFGRANNLAAQRAGDCEFLLLLNPDTVVQKGAIDRLVAFAQANPESSIFGGRTVFADGSLNPASCWRRPTLWSVFCIASGLTSVFGRWGLFASEAYGRWKRDTVREVDIVSGCFFLIRKRVWDELGGFDPAFFMYGEEADLCLRAQKFGHKCMICPAAQIIHYGGASERVRADKMVRLFQAKAMLFERHWSRSAAAIGVRLLDLWALSRFVAFRFLSLVQARFSESCETWRSIWSRRREWRPSAVPHPAVASDGQRLIAGRGQ